MGGKGSVYQLGNSRSRTVPCETGACLNLATAGDGKIMVTETKDPGHWFLTDAASLERFAANESYDTRGPDDNIGIMPLSDGTCMLFDRRHTGASFTTEEDIENLRIDIRNGGLGELATATAITPMLVA